MSLKLFVFFILINHFTNSEYCPKSHLTAKISSRATCYYKDAQVPCDDRIRPETKALLSCATGFIAPPVHQGLSKHLKCGANGNWDRDPYSCNMECGLVAPKTQEFSLGGNKINITEVPWHVGIYSNNDGTGYSHICGGTIISPKLVISAAHCFWDDANEMIYNASLFSVAAGKYYREYDSTEEDFSVQKRNISDITVGWNFAGRINNFKNDIAVIKLISPLKFTDSIRPVCIEFLEQSAKEVQNDWTGNFAGWGITEENRPSDVLQSVTMQTLSYSDCELRLKRENPNYILSTDKFCLFDEYGSTACKGDNGAGFVVPLKDPIGREVYRLVGIVSHGQSKGTCARNGLVVMTNIQWFERLIEPLKEESEKEF